MDQQCLRGWRTTEAEPIASAVTVQLGHLRDTGKGPVGLEMDFSFCLGHPLLAFLFTTKKYLPRLMVWFQKSNIMTAARHNTGSCLMCQL